FEAQTVTKPLRLDEVQTLSVSFNQESRERGSDRFTQGNDGTELTGSFPLGSGSLDLAIIVDDSSSMTKEHEDLADRLNDLLSELSGVDWQMGIATTSSSCLRPDGTTIFASDADYATRFREAVDAGTNGSGEERGLERGAELLRGECKKKTTPWVRDDSVVAVLFVSDENS